VCSGNIDSAYVNSRDQFVVGELVVGRVTGATHKSRLSILRKFDRGYGRQWGSFRKG